MTMHFASRSEQQNLSCVKVLSDDQSLSGRLIDQAHHHHILFHHSHANLLVFCAHGLPFELLVKLHHLRKLRWGKMEIPLNLQAKRSTCLCELREPEVAQLLFKANDPAEQQVFTIEFQCIKRPSAIRGEKFTDDERVFLMLLRVERRKHFS